MVISKRSKQLYDEIAQGWNTWDSQSVTAHVLMPERLRVNLSFFVPHLNRYCYNIGWDEVVTFGEHSLDGSYSEVIVSIEGGEYKVEATACKDSLCMKVTPIKARFGMCVALEAGELFSRKMSFSYEGDNAVAKTGDKQFTLRVVNGCDKPTWNPVTAPHVYGAADKAVYFTVNSSANEVEIDKMLVDSREKWLESTITAKGDLGEALSAMRRSLLWNKVYDFTNDRVVTPVSRNWCKRPSGFGDYVLFGWDTFFAALQYGLLDKNHAYSTFFSIMEEVTPEGMIPNLGGGRGPSRDRSEPQVGAMVAWKLYLQYGDKWFIEECFNGLLEWNRWRFRERDFNGDGLLELASTPWEFEPTDEAWNCDECAARIGAQWESGIDNSPMWDRAVFNEKLHCLELSYAGLNCLMVMDCEILEKMATLLGKEDERKELESRRVTLAEKINRELWDDSVKCYMNKHWNGEFDPTLSLTHFYALTAGIADKERENHLINDHLLNENEFWGDYVIPNIARCDATFPEQDYWRGRIWAPTNFIAAEGIMRTGRMDIWREVVRRGYNLFIKCWKEHGAVGENYNAITAESASDKFYHWGALMVYMAVSTIRNFNEWTDTTETYDKPDWLEEIRFPKQK